ncbi:MAG: hypothetical protein QRY71_05720 [Candidatus Rhabdochlamydia sp.]
MNVSSAASTKNAHAHPPAYLHQISQLRTPLKQLYAVPRAHFLQLIHDYPKKAGLYFNLARTLDSKARITLLCKTELTVIKLFQKAVDLLTEEGSHSLTLAQAFKEARFYSLRGGHVDKIRKKFYLKMIANSSCPEQFYRALASIEDRYVRLNKIHKLSKGVIMSNFDLLMKGLEYDPLDDEAYVTLAVGSYWLDRALRMPKGSIVCWKQLLLQAIDINPNSSSALFSLACMIQHSNVLKMDEYSKKMFIPLNEKEFIELKSQDDLLEYIKDGKTVLRVRLLNGEVLSRTDLLIRLYQLSDGKEAFIKALDVVYKEQGFRIFVEELLSSSVTLELKWDMVFSIIEYIMMPWDRYKEGTSHLFRWVKEHAALALEKQILLAQDVNEGSKLYDANVSFETLNQTSLKELLDLIQKEPKRAALYCNLARKFHLLGYDSDDSLHEFGYKDSSQLFFTAIKLDPMNSYFYYYFVKNNNNEHREESVKIYLMAIDLNPKESFFYSDLAKHIPRYISLFDGKKFSQNKLIFEALSLNPRNDEAYTYLGKIAKKEAVILSTGEILTRQECYLKALEINPRNIEAYIYLFLHLVGGQENLETRAQESQTLRVEVQGNKLDPEDLLLQACQIQRKIFFNRVSTYDIYKTPEYLKFLKRLKESALPSTLKQYVYARTLNLLRNLRDDNYFSRNDYHYDQLVRELFNFFRHEERIPLAMDPTLYTTKKKYLMDVYQGLRFSSHAIPAILELIRQLHKEELIYKNRWPFALTSKKEFIIERMPQLNHHPLAYCYLADLMEKDESVMLTFVDVIEIEESFIMNKQKFSKRELYLKAIERIQKTPSQNPIDLDHYAMSYSSVAHDLEQDERITLLDGSLVSSEELCLKALKLDRKCALAYHILARNFHGSIELEGMSYQSKRDLYLQAIHASPYDPIAYYELGRTLQEKETVVLMNGVTLSKKKLYIRAIQLGIKNPHTYYEMGVMMNEKDQIYFPWNPSVTFIKGNLLAKAFELAPTHSFYLYKFTDYLLKRRKTAENLALTYSTIDSRYPFFPSLEPECSASSSKQSSDHQDCKRVKTEQEENRQMTSSKTELVAKTFSKTVETSETTGEIDLQNIDYYIAFFRKASCEASSIDDFWKGVSSLATVEYKGEHLSEQQFYIQFLKEYPNHPKAYEKLRSLLTEFCYEDDLDSSEEVSSSTDSEDSLNSNTSNNEEEDVSSDTLSNDELSSDEEENFHSGYEPLSQ